MLGFQLFLSMFQHSTEYKTLFDLVMQWTKLSSTDDERLHEATLTKEFWQECPPKLAVRLEIQYGKAGFWRK